MMLFSPIINSRSILLVVIVIDIIIVTPVNLVWHVKFDCDMAATIKLSLGIWSVRFKWDILIVISPNFLCLY